MGLSDWLKSTSRFKRYDDAFALNRESVWRAVKRSLESPQNAGKSVWLVAHFVDTFADIQNQLDAWKVDYEVVSQPIDPNRLERSGLLSEKTIQLVLAELIPNVDSLLPEIDSRQTIAVIGLERHPQITHDLRIEAFCKQLPILVEYGYFLSLDDAVVQLVVNETSLKVLKQMGLNDNDLITSHMVTSRLKKVLARLSPTFTGDRPADSARQWLELNRSAAG